MTNLVGRLAKIDLIVFDKDGTLIDFHGMWGGWAVALARGLAADTGRAVELPLLGAFGVDARTGRTRAHGALAATPMARLQDLAVEVLRGSGVTEAAAVRAVAARWSSPDPVAAAQPLADLGRLLDGLAAGVDRGGVRRRLAIATTDDREPTTRTLDALGLSDRFAAIVCADDGVRPKPAPDMVHHLCAVLDVGPARTAVIGDSPSDLRMARAAGAGLTVGVLSGVGRRSELAPLADLILPSVAGLLP